MFNVLRRACVLMLLAAKQLRPDNFCTNSVDLPSGKVLNRGTMKRGLGALKTLAGAAAIAATMGTAEAGMITVSATGGIKESFWGTSYDGLAYDATTKAIFSASFNSETPVGNPASPTKVYDDGIGMATLTIKTGANTRAYDFTRVIVNIFDSTTSGNDKIQIDAQNLTGWATHTPGRGDAVGLYASYDASQFTGDTLDKVSNLMASGNLRYIYAGNGIVSNTFNFDSITVSGVPEPTSAMLLGAGVVLPIIMRCRFGRNHEVASTSR